MFDNAYNNIVLKHINYFAVRKKILDSKFKRVKIYERIDLSYIKMEGDISLRTPFHCAKGFNACRFRGCVDILCKQTLCIAIEICLNQPDPLKRPMNFQCEVSLFNDSTDVSTSLGVTDLIYKNSDCRNTTKEIARVNIDTIQTYIKENAIVLRWCINFKTQSDGNLALEVADTQEKIQSYPDVIHKKVNKTMMGQDFLQEASIREKYLSKFQSSFLQGQDGTNLNVDVGLYGKFWNYGESFIILNVK